MKEKILWPYLRQASRQLGWDEGVDWSCGGVDEGGVEPGADAVEVWALGKY